MNLHNRTLLAGLTLCAMAVSHNAAAQDPVKPTATTQSNKRPEHPTSNEKAEVKKQPEHTGSGSTVIIVPPPK